MFINYLDSCMISIPHVKEEQYQFVVQFLLDICCIPHVDKAAINETYYEEVPVKQPAAAAPANANTENKDGQAQDNTQPAQPEPPKTEKVKKERSNVCILKISECSYGTSQNVLDVNINNLIVYMFFSN
jgi:hypothetical protein